MRLLFANAEYLRSAGRYMRSNGSAETNWFLILAVVGIILLWIALYYWDQIRSRMGWGPREVEPSLFDSLCRAHHLGRAERALLKRAAETAQLESVEMVFLDPRILLRHAARENSQQEACTTLARRLFGAAIVQEAAESADANPDDPVAPTDATRHSSASP